MCAAVSGAGCARRCRCLSWCCAGAYGLGLQACEIECALLPGAGMRSAYARSNELGRLYTVLSTFILALWWGYPIVWGLAEGSNTISIKAEARPSYSKTLCHIHL